MIDGKELLFYGDVFVSFYFPFYWPHLYSFFRDNFLEILNSFLDCVVILFYNFSGDALYYFLFLVLCDSPSDGDSFDVGPILVLDDFFLVGDIVDPAFSLEQ